MPTYDYYCTECAHELEAFHAMSAAPLKDCPACGKPALKRKIGTGAGLIFKGSGFYQTDYRSDSYQKSAKAEKNGGGEGKKSESSSESKGESKPKTESAPKPQAAAPAAKT
ncbi:MAG: zinc ribbon domain-containing protein [Verrucomicrobia bacterium]|nr:zinc ribbon domain-containing protein [Verrucomicrobiota bacterium]MCH8512165.1 zinc ribbon domain-containing protein [Kiritimatiellia bacterium]